MEPYSSKPFKSYDLGKVLDLLLEYRLASSVRTYPTIWRMRLLLSSRVRDPEKDAAIWQQPPGAATAFALIWRRQRVAANLVLEYALHPDHCTKDLAQRVVAWGARRAHEIARNGTHKLKLYAGEHLL